MLLNRGRTQLGHPIVTCRLTCVNAVERESWGGAEVLPMVPAPQEAKRLTLTWRHASLSVAWKST